jgi:hypothetical protein
VMRAFATRVVLGLLVWSAFVALAFVAGVA